MAARRHEPTEVEELRVAVVGLVGKALGGEAPVEDGSDRTGEEQDEEAGALALRAGDPGGGVTAGTGTDDDEIELVIHTLSLGPAPLRIGGWVWLQDDGHSQ